MIQVAVADDHPLLRKGIVDHLKEEKIQVTLEANDGKDLLNRLEKVYKAGKTVDIVILDISMQPMTGTDCLPILRSTYKGINVIIMSNFREHEIINQHWNLGASCYLLKTQAPMHLIEAVHEVYKKGFFVTDEMLPAIQGNNLGVDIIEERKKKLKFKQDEITIMELMFYKENSTKEIADFFKITTGAVYDKKTRLYNKFREVGEYIHGELGLMRVAVQYGYVSIDKIGKV